MRLGNLPRQNQPNARASRLSRVKRHERIAGVEQADAVVLDHERDFAIEVLPAHADARRRRFGSGLRGLRLLQRSIDRIAHQVNEHLLDQIGINGQNKVRAGLDPDMQSSLQRGDALHKRTQFNRLQGW